MPRRNVTVINTLGTKRRMSVSLKRLMLTLQKKNAESLNALNTNITQLYNRGAIWHLKNVISGYWSPKLHQGDYHPSESRHWWGSSLFLFLQSAIPMDTVCLMPVLLYQWQRRGRMWGHRESVWSPFSLSRGWYSFTLSLCLPFVLIPTFVVMVKRMKASTAERRLN